MSKGKDTSGIEDRTTSYHDTERENCIGGGGCWATRRVDKLEVEKCEKFELGEEGEPQEKSNHRGECEFVEEIKESDNEGDSRIQTGEGSIEGENEFVDFEKGPEIDEECEVEDVDFESESERGEESNDDISVEDNVSNPEEGETTSDILESQVELQIEESGVDDSVTDVVTPALKLLIFNILMPCVDIYFDSSLILRLHPQFWGCILVIVSGLLIHFIFTCFAWWQAVTKCGGSSKAQKSKTKNSGPTISRVLRQK